MQRNELTKVLAYIKANYPNFMTGADADDIKMALGVWFDYLQEYDSKIVIAAIKTYSTNNNAAFAPTPGQLVAEIRKILDHVKQERYLTHMEAWEKVREVMSGATCYHNPDKAFRSLPEYIQQVVGSAGTLSKWSMMETERLETVIMPNFRDSYKAIVAEFKSRSMLPSSVAALIEGMSAKQVKSDGLVIPFKDFDGNTISNKKAL